MRSGGPELFGREVERLAIDRWLAAPRPSALLLSGAAGIGKTTLWDHAVRRPTGGDVVLRWRASQAEQDLAFSVLTALCDSPQLADFVETLAPPRRMALEAAFGRVAADPDRAPSADLIGLAVADLLRALAPQRRVLLAIDDLQWTDEPSARVLAFATRRLGDAAVSVIATWRSGGRDRPAPARPGLRAARAARGRPHGGGRARAAHA